MSDLDVLQGQIAYLKLWLGILLAADASLIGWTATSGATQWGIIVDLAAIAAIIITGGLYFLDRSIRAKIKSLSEY